MLKQCAHGASRFWGYFFQCLVVSHNSAGVYLWSIAAHDDVQPSAWVYRCPNGPVTAFITFPEVRREHFPDIKPFHQICAGRDGAKLLPALLTQQRSKWDAQNTITSDAGIMSRARLSCLARETRSGWIQNCQKVHLGEKALQAMVSFKWDTLLTYVWSNICTLTYMYKVY